MARRYRYAIYNDPIRPAHLAEEVTWNHRPLDVARIREAAAHLVGGWRRAGSAATTSASVPSRIPSMVRPSTASGLAGSV